MIKGIVFDFNGTLYWDSKLHYDAWREFSKIIRGTAFTDEEMREKMFGHTNADIIDLFGKSLIISTDRKASHFKRYKNSANRAQWEKFLHCRGAACFHTKYNSVLPDNVHLGISLLDFLTFIKWSRNNKV